MVLMWSISYSSYLRKCSNHHKMSSSISILLWLITQSFYGMVANVNIICEFKTSKLLKRTNEKKAIDIFFFPLEITLICLVALFIFFMNTFVINKHNYYGKMETLKFQSAISFSAPKCRPNYRRPNKKLCGECS